MTTPHQSPHALRGASPGHSDDADSLRASLSRLRSLRASWRHRLFAPGWERAAVRHAVVVLEGWAKQD